MKKLSIILIGVLVALAACTKSKEVHPEIGDGNDEIVTVGIDNVHIKYIRNDIASLQKVMFNYSLADEQQFGAAEMTKKSDCFELTLNNLESDTLYSYYYEVSPYSGNSYQTVQKSFRTQFIDTVQPVPPTPPSGVPTGAISGLFTINEQGNQVYFSQGNLQYQASTNTWRFAENQWDYVGSQTPGNDGTIGGTVSGSDNINISSSYNGWIDLFCWGTSGYNHGAVCYQPWSMSMTHSDYYAYNNYTNNLSDQTGQADWGYNPISNGGNVINQWKTLSINEWKYVINQRSTLSGRRYAKARVNGVNGLILLPDNWGADAYNLSHTNTAQASFYSNIISSTQWMILENEGAVFLPSTGYRHEAGVNAGVSYEAGYFCEFDACFYWTDSAADTLASYGVYFHEDHINDMWWAARTAHVAVRLVYDANR